MLRPSSWMAKLAIVWVLISLGADTPQAILRDGFESDRTTWRQEATDAAIRMIAHERSERAAHEGTISERFYFEAGPGSALYYSYPTPKIPITAKLQASLYVRSNRVGVALFGRVILPNDTDPETGQPTYLTIPGTVYEEADRWRRLEILEFPTAVERQARILRASSKRPVKIEGAYLERLLVNVHGGPGENEVFLDELAISPVPAELKVAAAARGDDLPVEEADDGDMQRSRRAESRITLPRNRMRKEGRDWFPTVIDAPGAEIEQLWSAGFDVLAVPREPDETRLRRAVENGMFLMPKLAVNDPESPMDALETMARIRDFPFRDSVAFWHLGDKLGVTPDLEDRKLELKKVREIVSAIRKNPLDASILTAGTISALWAQYGRVPQNLDLLGAAPTMWGSSVEPSSVIKYLSGRRDMTLLGNAEAFHWATIPCTPYRTAKQAVWGDEIPPAGGEPQVLPEQVRLFAYSALISGYRGLCFQADAQLTRPSGQVLLTELAFLNEEFDLVESIIAQGADPITIMPTYFPDPPLIPQSTNQNLRQTQKNPEAMPHPSIKVATIKTSDRKGTLLMVTDLGDNAQFIPPQLAANDVVLVIPGNEAAQAYEISPGGVTALTRTRVPGGIKITLPLFDVTSLILLTSDMDLIAKLENAVARVRPRAVQMAIEQAQKRFEQTTMINTQLAIEGHPTKSANELLRQSSDHLKTAREKLEDADYESAWVEARYSVRPLRVLMRAHSDDALKATLKAVRVGRGQPEDAPKVKPGTRPPKEALPGLILNPVSFPPMMSVSTLAQQYTWIDYIRSGQFGANLLEGGEFTDLKALARGGWIMTSGHDFDGVASKIEIDRIQKEHETGVLKLSVDAAVAGTIDDLPPTLEQPAAAISTPPIMPEVPFRSGQFVRISVQVKMPRLVTEGIGGLIIRDSWGGEEMQTVHARMLTDWKEFVIFRRCPANKPLTITLGLAGYGAVYFDNLRVDRVEDASIRNRPTSNGGGDIATRSADPDAASARRNAQPPRR